MCVLRSVLSRCAAAQAVAIGNSSGPAVRPAHVPRCADSQVHQSDHVTSALQSAATCM